MHELGFSLTGSSELHSQEFKFRRVGRTSGRRRGAVCHFAQTSIFSLQFRYTTAQRKSAKSDRTCWEGIHFHKFEFLSLALPAKKSRSAIFDETRLALGKASNVRRDEIFQASVCASFLCTRRRVGAGRIVGRALDTRGGRGGDRRFSAVNHVVCGRYRW